MRWNIVWPWSKRQGKTGLLGKRRVLGLGDSSGMPTSGAILFLYRNPPELNAPTILQDVAAFRKHSGFDIDYVNTFDGFPEELAGIRYGIIVMHYSVFGPFLHLPLFPREAPFVPYLESSPGFKVAFFQDEYEHCRARFDFLNRCRVDLVYTLLRPEWFDRVYRAHTDVSRIVHTIPGYVDEDLVATANRLHVPERDRRLDFGYRTRRLPCYVGKAGKEKTEIALRFKEMVKGYSLALDIEVDEESRIYGESWYRFLAECRAVLGVEAGVSIFDLDDKAKPAYFRAIRKNPSLGSEEVWERHLKRFEDRIYYRTISPRHFEAAALRICQVLFEGEYSGILKPMVHFIPLKKDFSNIGEVIGLYRDRAFRLELVENAYLDLIASGRYSYRRFIQSFDQELSKSGFRPEGEHAVRRD